MRLRDVLDVLAALEEKGVRYAVFGGLAMAAHGLDRATRDLDLFVTSDVDNVRRLREALHLVFVDDPSIDEITHEDLAGEYPAIQYGPPGVDFTIDIVSRLGTALTFVDLEVQRLEADGQLITVVSARTLHDMKSNTVRVRDADDARRLRERFGWTEEP